MGLIIGIGIWGSRKDSSSSTTDPGGIVATAALPTGVFGADMQVALVNDGPVTFLLKS